MKYPTATHGLLVQTGCGKENIIMGQPSNMPEPNPDNVPDNEPDEVVTPDEATE